jgi:hypothetical protein
LTKWRARSDSRRSRNEAAADLGVETAIKATARRGEPGPQRTGRRTQPRDGAARGATVAAAAKEVAAAGDMATRAGRGARGVRGDGAEEVAVAVAVRVGIRVMRRGALARCRWVRLEVWPTSTRHVY